MPMGSSVASRDRSRRVASSPAGSTLYHRSNSLFAERDLWNVGRLVVSLRLDASELYHLAPLLGFVYDQFAELGRRSRQRRAAEVGEARPHLGVGERRVDLFVELVHDLNRRVSRRTDPIQ